MTRHSGGELASPGCWEAGTIVRDGRKVSRIIDQSSPSGLRWQQLAGSRLKNKQVGMAHAPRTTQCSIFVHDTIRDISAENDENIRHLR